MAKTWQTAVGTDYGFSYDLLPRWFCFRLFQKIVGFVQHGTSRLYGSHVDKTVTKCSTALRNKYWPV